MASMEIKSINSKFWQNRNVFITGGTGLLGSWVIKLLHEKTRANIVVLIRDHIPDSHLFLDKMFPQVNVVKGSVEDYLLIERILGEYEIDTVLHLAAQTIAPIANRNPLSTFETNIKGTWTMLEACRRSPNIKKIIVSSSDKAYGESRTLPYVEETPLKGQHPYDVSKSCADLIAQAYYSSYNLPVCITRCGNLFGGGDLNFNRLVPSVIRSVLFGECPVLRSNGKFIRDFIYVEDAALGIIKAVESMDDINIVGQAFNFSNENPILVIDMVSLIMKKMNSKLDIKITNESMNEIYKQYLSAYKAKTLLDWKPVYSLETGLNKTIKWYKSFFNIQNK